MSEQMRAGFGAELVDPQGQTRKYSDKEKPGKARLLSNLNQLTWLRK